MFQRGFPGFRVESRRNLVLIICAKQNCLRGMLSCSFGTADSHKISSCLHEHQHELCKHEEFLNWILLVIELFHLPNGARDTDFWVATRGAHLLMPVTRPLLNFATSRCGEIFSSWASEQLPQQRRALILTSHAKQFCFGRTHSRRVALQC